MNFPEPTIQTLSAKLLLGSSLSMSIANNRTGELWGGFAPQISKIMNRVGKNKFSLQVYPPGYFQNFNPQKEFTKYALVEVESIPSVLPQGMELFELDAGSYAVFNYRGSSANSKVFEYIYNDWLPKSGYQLDDRPHFELLGEKYRNMDPNSEEEIWIPIC